MGKAVAQCVGKGWKLANDTRSGKPTAPLYPWEMVMQLRGHNQHLSCILYALFQW